MLSSPQLRIGVAGELLPPVAFGGLGVLGGLALGVLLVHASLGLLALRLLTGQPADPALVVPVLVLVPAAMLLLTVAVVVVVESSLHRRERLGRACGPAMLSRKIQIRDPGDADRYRCRLPTGQRRHIPPLPATMSSIKPTDSSSE
jgi:hypothetical protein